MGSRVETPGLEFDHFSGRRPCVPFPYLEVGMEKRGQAHERQHPTFALVPETSRELS
jgi:hypothetical protein